MKRLFFTLLLTLLLTLPLALAPLARANTSSAIISPVVYSTGNEPLAVKVTQVDATGTAVTPATATGAAHEANSQVTASTTAATLIAARPTRRSCLIKNTDATITVYIGAATVTSANGMPLKAGESTVVSAVTLVQVIAASGSPVVAVFDEYD